MFERTPGHNRHRDLWQEVLLQTVEDALLGPSQVAPAHRIRICQQARAYLTRPSADLAQVCGLAGLDMAALIERMTLRIAKAPAPEELLAGTRPRRATITKRPAKAKPTPFKHMAFTIDGITRTAAEWCERTGIKLDTARGRINAGWLPERAFTLTRADVRREHRARVELSYREAMQRTGQTLHNRTLPRSIPRYEHNGESLTLAEWSKRTGIKKGTLYKRIVLSGWTVAQALNPEMLRHPSKQSDDKERKERRAISASTPRYEHNGESLTLSQWAARVGIPKTTLIKRLRSGYTLAEALTPGRLRAKAKTPTSSTEDRGVVPNLRPSQWTGGGRSAQEHPNIAFSETYPVTSEVAA